MKIRIDLVLVQLVLIVLKLVGVIKSSWLLVLIPTLLILTVLALTIMAALALIILHLSGK